MMSITVRVRSDDAELLTVRLRSGWSSAGTRLG